ncbi:hypothetical protein chiPu_0033755, partial [Chiloscyllium punctatum]|nr:hypothetical protein [Chiloscyllium punctatum]
GVHRSRQDPGAAIADLRLQRADRGVCRPDRGWDRRPGEGGANRVAGCGLGRLIDRDHGSAGRRTAKGQASNRSSRGGGRVLSSRPSRRSIDQNGTVARRNDQTAALVGSPATVGSATKGPAFLAAARREDSVTGEPVSFVQTGPDMARFRDWPGALRVACQSIAGFGR